MCVKYTTWQLMRMRSINFHTVGEYICEFCILNQGLVRTDYYIIKFIVWVAVDRWRWCTDSCRRQLLVIVFACSFLLLSFQFLHFAFLISSGYCLYKMIPDLYEFSSKESVLWFSLDCSFFCVLGINIFLLVRASWDVLKVVFVEGSCTACF